MAFIDIRIIMHMNTCQKNINIHRIAHFTDNTSIIDTKLSHNNAQSKTFIVYSVI